MTSEAGNDVMKSPPEKSARGFFVRSGIREKAHGQKTGVPVFLSSREDAVPERSVMRHAPEERREKPRHGCLRRARVSARDAAGAFLKERRLFCPAGRKKVRTAAETCCNKGSCRPYGLARSGKRGLFDLFVRPRSRSVVFCLRSMMKEAGAFLCRTFSGRGLFRNL